MGGPYYPGNFIGIVEIDIFKRDFLFVQECFEISKWFVHDMTKCDNPMHHNTLSLSSIIHGDSGRLFRKTLNWFSPESIFSLDFESKTGQERMFSNGPRYAESLNALSPSLAKSGWIQGISILPRYIRIISFSHRGC